MRNELVYSNVPVADVRIEALYGDGPAHGVICTLHYHDELEIISVTEGEMEFSVDDKRYRAQTGDTVFCSARIPHATYLIDGSCRYTLIQFRPEKYLEDDNNNGKYFNRFIRSSAVPFAIVHNNRITALIATALEETRSQREAWDLSVKGLVYSLLSLLCREGVISSKSSVYSADVEKIRPALAYIEEHYSENITLNDISAVQNLNPSYFCRIFKRASGSNFIDYLNFVRVCKSERLLANENASILSIAYDVGFSSVSYFNRIFKRYKNCTPTAYRRAQYEKM